MIWFYPAISVLFLVIGFLFIIRPAWMRKMMQWIMDKDLFHFIGVLEIALGLGTLYFRHGSHLLWFVFVAGFLFFIDGILYLLSSGQLKTAYAWFIGLEDKGLKIYGIFMFLIFIGYFCAGTQF